MGAPSRRTSGSATARNGALPAEASTTSDIDDLWSGASERVQSFGESRWIPFHRLREAAAVETSASGAKGGLSRRSWPTSAMPVPPPGAASDGMPAGAVRLCANVGEPKALRPQATLAAMSVLAEVMALPRSVNTKIVDEGLARFIVYARRYPPILRCN